MSDKIELQKEISKLRGQRYELISALLLAKETLIQNGFASPITLGVIDEAIKNAGANVL